MSLYVVERENPDYLADLWWERERYLLTGRYPRAVPYLLPEVVDCNDRDGEWHATITMPHEVVEHEGYAVPAFEGDVERIEWERARRP